MTQHKIIKMLAFPSNIFGQLQRIYFHIHLELEVQFFTDKNGEQNGQDLGSKVNDHFKVGHYKSLEREKEDEKNVEESEETDEEKEHTDENEDDITQLAQGPKKESGTSDEKDETRRRLCDLGTWLGIVNELTDREKYIALTDPFVPPRHFKFPVTEKKNAAKKVILTNLTELSIHKAWTLFCANYCILFDNGSK